MKSRSSLSLLAASAALLTVFPGCRFKSPSVAEQAELSNRGALAANNSDWVAAPLPRGQQLGGASYSSGIPDYTRGPAPIDPISNGLAAPKTEVQTVSRAEQPSPEPQSPQEVSPLTRISRTCPGTDEQVNDALKTVDQAERIKKYEALTKECPASSELWMWLGLDYEKAGEIDLAKQALSQAVVLRPSNQEAKGYLAEVQKKIAESMRAK